jgi:hypothetical protein
MISNDEAVEVEFRGMLVLMVALATSSLRPRGNGSDSMESCTDEEGVELGFGIGIAVVGEASEMENRLVKGLCGCDCGRDFLVGEGERDFRSKKEGE